MIFKILVFYVPLSLLFGQYRGKYYKVLRTVLNDYITFKTFTTLCPDFVHKQEYLAHANA